MKLHSKLLLGLAATGLLAATGSVVMAEGQDKAASAQAEQRSDKDVAAQYGSEAAQLRAKAKSHRALANEYRSRTGKHSYAQIAGHCDQLAKFYEDAAKEAEAVSSELSK